MDANPIPPFRVGPAFTFTLPSPTRPAPPNPHCISPFPDTSTVLPEQPLPALHVVGLFQKLQHQVVTLQQRLQLVERTSGLPTTATIGPLCLPKHHAPHPPPPLPPPHPFPHAHTHTCTRMWCKVCHPWVRDWVRRLSFQTLP